jgi:hypothetical protein
MIPQHSKIFLLGHSNENKTVVITLASSHMIKMCLVENIWTKESLYPSAFTEYQKLLDMKESITSEPKACMGLHVLFQLLFLETLLNSHSLQGIKPWKKY